MDIAKRCAEMSYASRATVGAVIVKDGNVVSLSWNGMPAGMDNTCEDIEYPDHGDSLDEYPLVDNQGDFYRLVTKKDVIHAEENAICKSAKSGTSLNNAEMYVTLSPCINCARLIANSGIKRVVFGEQYRDNAGIEILKSRGVEVNLLCKESTGHVWDPVDAEEAVAFMYSLLDPKHD